MSWLGPFPFLFNARRGSSSSPPRPAPLFESDWSTAQGNTDAALRDTAQTLPWTTAQAPTATRLSSVVSAAGLGFPAGMANVLQVRLGNDGVAAPPAQVIRVGATVAPTAWPTPAVGESLYYRVYKRVTIDDAYISASTTHPVQDGNAAGGTNWMFVVESNAGAGVWRLKFEVAMAFPNNFWTPPLLNRNQTYRFEWRVHRISATQFNLHARIYDSAGALLYDDDDFNNANNSAQLDDLPALDFRAGAVDNLRGMNAGTNGLGNNGQSGLFPMTLYYQGGVQVRSDDWCGAYE